MNTLLPTMSLTLLIFSLAILGIGIGVVVKRRPIKGSCGGCGRCLQKRTKT